MILKPVPLFRLEEDKDIKFLFDLLKERTPIHSISHTKMPTYEEHAKFVKSKPYDKWYIITVELIIDWNKGMEETKIGTIYLTNKNEIGLFLLDKYSNHGYGQQALKLLMRENPRQFYLANINPQNEKSIRFFSKNNFKPYQVTYRSHLHHLVIS